MVPGGPQIGSTERPWRLTFGLAHNYDSDLVFEDESRNNRQHVIGVTNTNDRMTLGIAYTATDQLQVQLEIPWAINQREEQASNNFYVGQGIGDVVLRGQYYLWTPAPEQLNPYVELGCAFPTGDEDKDFFNRKTGKRAYMKPYITPGYGTFSPIVGLGVQRSWGDLTAYLWTRYAMTLGTNDADYEPGNPFTASLGASYIVHRASDKADATYVGFSCALNHLLVYGREERAGVDVGNTGGYWLRLEPGVFFSPDGGNFTLEVTVPFPLYWDVNELQTLEKYGVNITAAYRF